MARDCVSEGTRRMNLNGEESVMRKTEYRAFQKERIARVGWRQAQAWRSKGTKQG